MQSSNLVPLHDSVRSFISSDKKMLINGKWMEPSSGQYFATYNPATGEKITQVAEGTEQDINKAVLAARHAFETSAWRTMKPSDKSKILWKIGDLILEHEEEFAQLESIDNGKPVAVARVADIPLAADLFHYMAGWVTKMEGETIPISVPYMPDQKFLAYTQKDPIGVIGQIIPWNFPLLMAAWKLGPALAAGNTLVMKPAEQTPLSCLRLGELMMEAGIPDGVVNIVPGFGETAGASLAKHKDVDKVAFTGSTEVGKLIVAAAQDNLKKVSLELGGKSPNVIFKDVHDIQAAIQGAANAIFFNHGQCCCAGSRLYIEHDIFDEVVAGVKEFAKNIKIGPGMDESSQMGPLVSRDQFDKVCGYMNVGNDQAKCVIGGKKFGEQGYFVEPTVYTHASQDLPIVKEEIFGPVVVAESFTDIEELIPMANRSQYGLAAGVWTKDISKAHRTAERLRAGTVWINCYNVFDAALPFGGFKQSGWGREMGKEVLNYYTETKSVCVAL